MYSRSFHTKSRNGCGQCKRRHIRCDQKPPICSKCAKGKRTCDYQSLPVSLSNPTAPTSSIIEIQPSIGYRTTFPISPVTLLSLIDYDIQIWETNFAHIYSQHFVTHSILAVSDLYLQAQAGQEADKTISATALSHQIVASSLFRESISQVNEHNWPAVLVFAIALGVFHFYVTSRAQDCSIHETLLVLRESSSVAREIGPYLARSGFIVVLDSQRTLLEAASLPDDLSAPLQAIHGLESFIIFNKAAAASEVYLGAVAALKSWLLFMQGRPRTWRDFIIWPASISPECMALFKSNDPLAAVIFLHWCAVMHNAPSTWFLRGWARKIAVLALRQLNLSEWYCLLGWAMTRLEIQHSSPHEQRV